MKNAIAQIVKYAEQHPEILSEGEISVRKLGMGEANANYFLRAGEKEFVFRIPNKKESWVDLRDEFLFLQRLPGGFGPVPTHLDVSCREFPYPFCVLEFVQGRHLQRWSNRHLQIHAIRLAELHRHSRPYFELERRSRKLRRFDIVDQFDHEVEEFAPVSPADRALVSRIRAFLLEKNDLFLALRRFSLCHGDPCNPNILFHKGKVVYIDWEWARYFDAASDLSLLFHRRLELPPWRIRLHGARLDHYCDSYLNVRKDATLRERMDVWVVYYMAIELLYCEWKLRNFVEQESPFPRKFYAETAEKVRTCLKDQFVQ